jgi:hypothetical protein
VPFRAQETLASIKAAGWASPAHITFAGDRRDWEWRGMSPHPESAIGRMAGGTERRDRTTTVALQTSAQNGTSGALAGGNHAGRRAAWATPQTGVGGRSTFVVRGRGDGDVMGASSAPGIRCRRCRRAARRRRRAIGAERPWERRAGWWDRRRLRPTYGRSAAEEMSRWCALGCCDSWWS